MTALQAHLRRYHGIEQVAPTMNPEAIEHERWHEEPAEAAAETQPSTPSQTHEDDPIANDEGISEMLDEPFSAPARRHMEARLAQMEKERAQLDIDIAHLRHRLYGHPGISSVAEGVTEDLGQRSGHIVDAT